MEFTDEAIEFMKDNDEFVNYYHNYYKDEPRFRSFREMVDERTRVRQVLRHEGLIDFARITYHLSLFLL